MVERGMLIVSGCLMIGMSIQDIRKQQISIGPAICIGILGMINQGIWKRCYLALGSGLLFGLLFVIISLITHQAIGLGDCLVIMVTGIMTGGYQVFMITIMAFMAAALVSLFMLAVRRADRKKSLPFIPFLALSYWIMVLL